MRFGGDNMVSALGLESNALRNGVAFNGRGWREKSGAECLRALTGPLTDPRTIALSENFDSMGLYLCGNQPLRRTHEVLRNWGVFGGRIVRGFRFAENLHSAYRHELLQPTAGMPTAGLPTTGQVVSRATLEPGGGL
jgi:hypothetical protein